MHRTVLYPSSTKLCCKEIQYSSSYTSSFSSFSLITPAIRPSSTKILKQHQSGLPFSRHFSDLPLSLNKKNHMIIAQSAFNQLVVINKAQNNLSHLRLSVDSGGCHGFQYTFTLDQTVNKDDTLFESTECPSLSAGFVGKVLVDDISMEFLRGATVEWNEELMGSAFRVTTNPNAVASCGCKISFGVS